MRDWFKSGDPWIWLTASTVSVSIIMVVGLLLLIAARGLVYFWPADVIEAQYLAGDNTTIRIIGEVTDSEVVATTRLKDMGVTNLPDLPMVERHLVKVGNRDLTGRDFRWIAQPLIKEQTAPESIVVVERREWGNAYGYLKSIRENGTDIAQGDGVMEALEPRLERALTLHGQIEEIEKHDIGAINYGLERLRLRERYLELNEITDPQKRKEIEDDKKSLNSQYGELQSKLGALYQDIQRDALVIDTADGSSLQVPLAKVVRIYQPNAMGTFAKTGYYLSKVWEFVSDDPREANTEGGIFPAIFGTVLMVIIMSIIVTPFGVVAAVYLREYAKQGWLTRTIRIAVNNLAGVPSIVYGVFGLGFFVYFLGGNLDQLFYPEALPAPTFGTPGIMWASLTLAILTLPVVIVATEEGLSRIPRSIREGSLALGATKAETLWRTVMPMASPAMMTGLILAVARAAGEVAPLMLVGVVKLAPSLPLDTNFPFLHMERKFMHLGFHIYDVGFQSPNVEAARPLVYATALLLVLVIILLNLAAIGIRNHLREKYRSLEG
ncbi:MAG: phosphate ABC transporter permease [Acidithiobacillales bacterium SG8_45]|nr:MAG: phosphate ABC transporter permease [Acidithiobacillales bacterium SG8_45]